MSEIYKVLTIHASEVIFILIFTAVLSFAARCFLGYVTKKHGDTDWISALSNSLYFPIAWVIWGYGILFAVEILAPPEDFIITDERALQARRVFLILGMAWILMRSKKEIEGVLVKRLESKRLNKADKALYLAMWRLSTIAVFVFVGLLIFDAMGVSLAAFLTVGGVGALGISLAASDIVKNFFGGFMIYVNRNFAAGDWIYSPNKNFEGTVEEIGWYHTRIRSFERRPVFIPNSLLTDAIVENPGRMYNRRIKTNVGVRYADIGTVKVITEDIEKMLREHPAIAQDQTLMVHFLNFGASSLDINIYCFTKTTDWKESRSVTQDVFLKVGDIIASHNAEIAFPTRTLHLINEG